MFVCRKAYRRLAMSHHPDRHSTAEEKIKVFHEKRFKVGSLRLLKYQTVGTNIYIFGKCILNYFPYNVGTSYLHPNGIILAFLVYALNVL